MAKPRRRRSRRGSTATPGVWRGSIGTVVGAHKGTWAGAVVVSIAAGLLASVLPLVQKVIVDDVITDGTRDLAPWLGAMLAVGLATFATTAGRRYLGARFSIGVQHDLRTRVYTHLHNLDERVRSSYPPGDVFSRATADISLLQGVLGRMHLLIGHTMHLATALVAMVVLSVPLALLVGLLVPVFLATAGSMRSRVFPSAWHDQRSLAETTTVVAEAVGGMRVIKAFGRNDGEVERYAGAATGLFRSRLRTTRLSALFTATLEALPSIAQVVVVGVGGWLAIGGSITIGTFVAFATYVGQMLRPVRSLATFMANVQQARAGAERVSAFLDEVPTVVDRDDARPLETVDGVLEFDDVTFGYEPDRPVLEGFSLTIRAGERVAVVGRSGSGKSTLAKLLVRLYDVDGGAIRLDGVDIRDLPTGMLRRQVGGTIDEPFLFSSTIGENIAFGRDRVTAVETASAAEVAGLGLFVGGLPGGFDTVVGERGLTLSGGQRQRLTLARAVMADPRVLILDDATSAIDARTESLVHERLAEFGGDRTTIVIAHRRSTLRLVDRIVVMDGGRVVADGTAADLLATSPEFRGIWGTAEEPGDDIHEGPLEGVASATATATASIVTPPTTASRRARDGMATEAVVTSDLLEAVAALPPLTGDPDRDLAAAEYDGRLGIRGLIRPFRAPMIAGLVLVAVAGAMALVGPILVRRAIDVAIVEGSRADIVTTTIALLVVVIAGWAAAVATGVHTSRTAERMLYVLRERSFRHLLDLPLRYFDRETTGRIIARLTADVEALALLFQQGLVGTAVSSFTALGVLVVLFVLDWVLALAVLSVFVPLTFMTIVFRAKAKRAHVAVRETISGLYSELAEGIDGVGTTQVHVREGSQVDRLVARSLAYAEARLRSNRLGSLYFPGVQFMAAVAATIVLGIGAVQVGDGILTLGSLLAFLLYVDHLFRPMQELSEQIDQWTAARVSLHKIADLLDEEPERLGVPGLVAPEGPLGLDLRDVSFAYPGFDVAALSNVSLRIRAGETVAIVGESGAGKSSLAKLLMTFYTPTTGAIGVNGEPLDDVDRIAHRRRIGYVPQEPVLFGVSVRDNLAYGRPEATADEVEQVAIAVGIHDTIMRLPDGYDTVVLHGGGLSAGERQLICLARAFLVEPDLLILDEATANLDLRSEALVQRAMRAGMIGCTTVVIAHRLQTVVDADRIVVLEAGRLAEDGPHDDLVHAEGPYAEMWAAFAEAESGGGGLPRSP